MAEVIVRRTPEEAGDLVGAVEASEILDVERTRVSRYVKTGVMPEPVAKLRATSVWLRSDVEELAAKRRGDRPKKK
jgi:predicted DNA-binding transcriptional regulator AlpA